MFRKFGLRAKMLFAICGVVLLSYAVTISYIAHSASHMARSEAEEKALEMASKHGLMIQADLDNAMDIVRAMAHALEGVKMSGQVPDRGQINAMLKNLLKETPDLIGMASCWEPDALDGRDADFMNTQGHDESGRFAPYWNRGNGTIEVEPLVNFDTDAWYQIPKRTGKEIITEPYVYPVGGKDVLMTTVVAPIKANGTFLGIVTADIALDAFGKMMADVKPFNSGYGYLLSNEGFTVYHPNKAVIGKNAADVIKGKERAPFIDALKKGQTFSMVRQSENGGMDTFQILVPITIGKTDTPWAIGIVAPLDEMLAGAQSLRNTSIVIGVAGFLLLVGVVWFVSMALVIRPINGVVAGLRDIAEGEGDLTLRLPVTTSDEIGQLSSWFNTFIEKLQRIIGELAGQATGMDDSSRALLGVAGDLASQADNTSERSTSVSGAAEEMTANINDVAAAMEQTSANSDMVATAAEEMTATIGEVAKQSETARSISEKPFSKPTEHHRK